MALKARIAGLVTLAALALPSAANAQQQESSAAQRASEAHKRDQQHTMVSASAGLLSLPAAEVCRSPTNCEKGETGLSLGLYNHYRFGRLAFGASLTYGTSLTAGAGGGAAELDRSHNRSYFMVEAQARYYALRRDRWEWWGGVTLGGIVIRDGWSVVADRDPYSDTDYVGPREATLSTEGLAAGLAVGGAWTIAENWSVGTTLRYALWFLPDEAVVSPTGDSASLSGRVHMLDFGLNVAYRLAL
jgi:hypothetical protein